FHVTGVQTCALPIFDVADGDYYFVKAKQADGAQLVSAPIWIGEKVRGANYAPDITVDAAAADFAAAGERIEIPRFSAVDDSGERSEERRVGKQGRRE